MPPPRREQLQEQKQRTVSIRSTLSERSIPLSTTTEYLEERVKLVQSQFDYHKICLDGLAEIKPETLEKRAIDEKSLGVDEASRSIRGATKDFDDELKIQKSRAPAETGLTKEGMLSFSKPHETWGYYGQGGRKQKRHYCPIYNYAAPTSPCYRKHMLSAKHATMAAMRVDPEEQKKKPHYCSICNSLKTMRAACSV
ncbi:hypothetical protein LTR20_009082 [Exophiala xenobiotica]|nr:hypothetical protein LTR79_005215 [Exophiala xenobiotica]KAK5456665.1 hypothetical protein LTR20_009082 [Exophiala xenobiotica]KAK5473487.1 hypothetical protein LTR26_010206 [Exophiala xenobiotica]KAK5482639.1 hypothetical protein LTR83_009455 [Exophiala xenobiotica]KAK5508494.1 hypothetical protein LTR21_008292 [Exophiala xenobiotica]